MHTHLPGRAGTRTQLQGLRGIWQVSFGLSSSSRKSGVVVIVLSWVCLCSALVLSRQNCWGGAGALLFLLLLLLFWKRTSS